jgi:lipoate-protein ligase A
VPATLRLYRPDRIVAFGGADVRARGFRAAVAAARDQGYASVKRLAGGRAAVFHEGTIAFARSAPDSDPTARTFARFEDISSIMAAALTRLGVDARVGEVPGEYCPGDFSVNAGGRKKLVGIGQRIVAKGAHIGGVLVATGSVDVRDVLVPVYDALELDWDPDTTGSVVDEVPVDWDAVRDSVVDEFARHFELVDGRLDDEALGLAKTLAHEHKVYE